MYKITKETLNVFLEYYHYFHDGIIEKVNYDIKNDQIELIVRLIFKGEIKLSLDGKTYLKNETTIRLLFKKIVEINIKEIFSWDFIGNAFLKYLKLNNNECICFATNENNPDIYIVSEFLEYEEI